MLVCFSCASCLLIVCFLFACLLIVYFLSACLLLVCLLFASLFLTVCSRVLLVCFPCASFLLLVCFLHASLLLRSCFFLIRVWCLRGFGWGCFLAAFLVLSRGPGIADTRAGESKNSASKQVWKCRFSRGSLKARAKLIEKWASEVAKSSAHENVVENFLHDVITRGTFGASEKGPKKRPYFCWRSRRYSVNCKSWEREARQGRRVGPKTVEHETRFS